MDLENIDDDIAAVGHEIHLERLHQVTLRGHTYERDDGHIHGQLSAAARSYLLAGDGYIGSANAAWPFVGEPFIHEHQASRPQLIKSAALLIAEIQRRDRAANHKDW